MMDLNNTLYSRFPTNQQPNTRLNPPHASSMHRQSAGLSHPRSQMASQSAGLVQPRVPMDRLSVGPTISGSSSSDLLPPPVGSSSTGSPISFLTGSFAGVTLRAEIQELQKADVGRKYGWKDRRLLDPPPVVKLRLFQMHHPGTAEGEREIDADDIRNIGLVCFADLYSVPEDHDADENQSARYFAPPLATSAPLPSFEEDVTSGRPLAQAVFPDFNPSLFPSTSQPAASVRVPPTWFSPEIDPSLHLLQSFPGSWSIPAPTPLSPSIVFPALPESAEDLAVKIEGRFLLRYRVFDIFSSTSASGHTHPALAECLGGPFQIYSTKKFPGLRASTDLTKHLSYLGAKVTSRQHAPEAKRRHYEMNETPRPHRTGPVAIAPGPSAGHMTTSTSMFSTFMATEDPPHQYGKGNRM